MNNNKGIAAIAIIIIIVIAVAVGGVVVSSQKKAREAKKEAMETVADAKPEISAGVGVTVSGTLSKVNGQFVITTADGTSRMFYVKNSSDASVQAALESKVGRQVEIYGSAESQTSGDVTVLWADGESME